MNVRGVTVREVVWFNYPMYAGGIATAVACAVVTAAGIAPLHLGLAIAFGALASVWWIVASIVASSWVFQLSGATRWTWIPTVLGGHVDRWLNITSGFDDTTGRLRAAMPGSSGTAVDVFDGHGRHDGALRRARSAFPPSGQQVLPGERLPVDDASQDAVVMAMSAHELEPGHIRDAVFADVARALRPGGRLVIIEFVGDLGTVTVFGPGAFHFESAATWRTVAAGAGLRRVSERRLATFARAFVFERPQEGV